MNGVLTFVCEFWTWNWKYVLQSVVRWHVFTVVKHQNAAYLCFMFMNHVMGRQKKVLY